MAIQTDVVCGAQVDTEKSRWSFRYLESDYFFCSEGCLNKFEQRPEDYVIRPGQARVDETEQA